MDVVLREIRRSDLEAINSWRGDRAVTDQLGGTHRFVGLEIDEQWFDSYLKSRANNVRLAICERATEEPIGVAYLLGIDWVNRSAEFAIQIGVSDRRGSGIGSRATREVLEHAFNDLGLHRVHLSVLEYNQAAIKLYRKVGFVEEGRLRKAVLKNGHHVDLIVMAILAAEFQGTSENGK